MLIKYSQHLERRLILREIDYKLPEEIFKNAEERFVDTLTGHNIAVKRTLLYGKERDVMIAHVYEEDFVKLLTIHHLKEGQKENRVRSGRWRRLQ
jgi:hypothetical protein